MHKVMNCKDKPENHKFGPGYISPKYDGLRGFYYPDKGAIYSRDYTRYVGLDHIVTAFMQNNYKHVADVEIFIPGMEFNKASGLIRSYNPTPEARAMVIDTPSFPGLLADRLSARCNVPGIIDPIPHKLVTDHDEVQYYYEKYLNEGFEGLVWKSADHVYRNQRSYHWIRWVPVHSADCMCLGVYEGNGKMAGIAGGIYIRFNGMECKVGTMLGVDYTEREYMLRYSERYIGRTAIVEYKELQPSGKPRQARFKGWRYDKEADA